MPTELTIEARVRAGAAWLDEHDPGWWRVDAPPRPTADASGSRPIDLTALQMSDPCGCVLGHRYGSYYQAPTVARGWWYGFDHGPGDPDTAADAFDPDEWRAEWGHLTDEWARVIEARRAEVADAQR